MIPDRATHLFRGYKGCYMMFEIWVDAAPYGERSGSYAAELAVCKSRLAKRELTHVDIVTVKKTTYHSKDIGTETLTVNDTKPTDILT